MGRDLLYQDLVGRLARAGHDEQRVIDRVLARLELGRRRYGPLNLAGDRRNWRRERFEERLDALVYDVCAELADEERELAIRQEGARSEIVGEWQGEQATRVSQESARIALDDIADGGEIYDEWDLSDVGGEGG